jgi:hypothetical protein
MHDETTTAAKMQTCHIQNCSRTVPAKFIKSPPTDSVRSAASCASVSEMMRLQRRVEHYFCRASQRNLRSILQRLWRHKASLFHRSIVRLARLGYG